MSNLKCEALYACALALIVIGYVAACAAIAITSAIWGQQ